MQDRWKEGIFVGLQNLSQAIDRVVIYLRRPGTPPIKPTVSVSGEYAKDPLYHQLETSVTKVTNVMSQCGWDEGSLSEDSLLDRTFSEYAIVLKKIRKQKGEPETQRMLDAAIDKIGSSHFFQTLPDADFVKPRWEETLRTHFNLALHGIPQAHTEVKVK